MPNVKRFIQLRASVYETKEKTDALPIPMDYICFIALLNKSFDCFDRFDAYDDLISGQ